MTTLIVSAIFILIGLSIMILSGCFPSVNQILILPILGEIIALCVLLQVTRYQDHALDDMCRPVKIENSLSFHLTNTEKP